MTSPETTDCRVLVIGAGGAGVRAAFPEEAKALALQRREEIEKTGADAVVSVCPFCEFHLREHTGRRVQNVCTLLLEGYREKDRRESCRGRTDEHGG